MEGQMKRENPGGKVEVIFKNDLDIKNKLVVFIINKILEDYDKLGGLIDGNKTSDKGGNC